MKKMNSISIIICTHNRSNLVKDLVLSFNNQNSVSKSNTEIIVVASACSDDTVNSLGLIKNKVNAEVKVIDVELPGLSVARNHGLKAAKNKYIAFLDDDVRLFPGWIDGIYDAFNNYNCEIVGGCIQLWWHNVSEPSWLHYYHKRLLGYNEHGSNVKPIEPGNIFGGNFAIKKNVYKKIGGFSSAFGRKGTERLAGEEADYFMRAKVAGFRFIYTPYAAVEHLVNQERASIEYLTRSALGVGQSRVILPDRANSINLNMILTKLELLFNETILEIETSDDSSKYMYHKTRRFDLLGESIGVLKYLFGELDLSDDANINTVRLSLFIAALKDLQSKIENEKNSQSIEVKYNDEAQNKNKLRYAVAAQELRCASLSKIESEEDSSHKFKISVIIPCFNVESLIVPCLKSLSKQTISQDSYEVICVDDCSTDGSVNIIESFKGKIKNLVVIRHQSNRKQGAARNTGLNVAKGEYITFVDADDCLTNDAIETFYVSVMGRELLVAQHLTVNTNAENKERISERRLIDNLSFSVLSGQLGWWPFGMLISRKLLQKNNIRFREGVFFEDIDFVISVCLMASSYVVINNALYKYFVHPESTVNSLNHKKLEDSVKAVWAVFSNISNVGKKAFHAWLRSSSNWLLYQIERIIEQNQDIKKRAKLFESYCIELSALRLVSRFGREFEDAIINNAIVAFTKDNTKFSRNGGVNIAFANHLARLGVHSVALIIYERLVNKSIAYKTLEYNIKYSSSKVDLALSKKNDLSLKHFSGCREIDYLMIPHNKYHADNLARIAIELNKKGLECRLLKVSPPHPDEGGYLSEYKSLYIDVACMMHEEILPYAIVVMNDWEPYIASKLVSWANSVGLATYGIVEGVNDYHDVDTGYNRRAYQRVRNLFLNGEFDKKYFLDSAQRIETVGIDRLDKLYERIRNVSLNKLNRVVINCNFTYGVLADQAQKWIDDVVTVCGDSSIDYVISKHPADVTNVGMLTVSDRPLYDEIIESNIFITRFSGAVFEALIAGCKVIYYNPGIEKIDKFNDPMGAYLYATSLESLQDSIQKITDGWTPFIFRFLKLHADCGYDSRQISGYHSLEKSVELLFNDSVINSRKVKQDQAGGHIYFDKKFNDWRMGKWAIPFY